MNFNFVGYLVFAFITCFTPGPNNLMLLSYGKAYGFSDSSKVMAGIFLGFFIMLYLAGYGIAKIIASGGVFELTIRIIGSAWLVYLAFLVRKMNADIDSSENVKIGFKQAFIQQFVNPKAWVMAISGASAFMPQFGNIHLNVFVFTLIFTVVGIPSMITWVMIGDLIAKMFKSEKSNQVLGYTMFSLMIACVITIWI